MRISVIIPYYNAEPWIGRCAESLKRQEGDHEFIFVNDHSTDGSYDALYEKTKDDKRFIRITEAMPPSYGVSGARNTGLEVATGDWITFLDADDEMLEGALGIYEEDAEENAGPIYQENHLRYYAATGVTRKMYENPRGVYKLENLPLCWFGVWNKLYKRELLQGVRFKEGVQFGEDELFNLECLRSAREIHSSGRLTVKHNIENMQSLTHTRTDEDLIRQLEGLCEIMRKYRDPGLRKVAYNTLLVHMNESWYFHGICGE